MTWLTWVSACPDGSLLGIGSQDGTFTLWSLREKAAVHSFNVGRFVSRARWTPDGQRLLIATEDARVLVRSGDGRSELGEIQTKHGRIGGLAVHPQGDAWATCGDDASVRIWDPQTLQLRLELLDGKLPARTVGFAKGSVVAGYDDGYFVAWSEDGKEKLATGAVMRWPPVSCLAVHPSGERIVFGGGKGGMTEVVVGEPGQWRTGNVWRDTPPKPIAVNALEFGPDGRFVAAFSDDTARVFRSTTDISGSRMGLAFYVRTPKPAWQQEFIVSGACFIPGSDLIATSHFDGALRLWKGYDCVETLRLGTAPEARLLARSAPECRLYMSLHPCPCGEFRPPSEHAVVQDERGLHATYHGVCPKCRRTRRFEFDLDPETPPLDAFGGSSPSRLLCPGQFALHSDRLASAWPVEVSPQDRDRAREDLAWAVRALEEVLKFVPAGADAVPAQAFTSAEGRAAYDAEPGRFRVVRLQARLAAYREILTAMDRAR